MPNASKPKKIVLFIRNIPCLILLWHINYSANELFVLPIFLASFFLASALGIILRNYMFRFIPAFLALLSIPWLIRFLVLMVSSDTFLLLFDNYFYFSLIPFYWAGFFSYYTFDSDNALRMEVFANALLLAVLFTIHSSKDIELYNYPIVLAGTSSLFICLELFILNLSRTPSLQIQPVTQVGSFVIMVLFSALVAFLILGPFEERSIQTRGGLLKADLFKFDFSHFLRLESEISLNNDLVLIVKKNEADQHILLRRFILSGYDAKRGFFLDENIDEAIHPSVIPDVTTKLKTPVYRQTNRIEQEYYLINFDASVFIAMNQPIEVHPYVPPRTSSFTSVYSVASMISEAYPFELDTITQSGVKGKLGQLEYQYYVEFGGNKHIQELAQLITDKMPGYWDKVQAVYEWLKYGEYRYSLKPGIASDGDQLGHFLFSSKKGYCSYFAFSMALLLRSQGIPARVVLGFYIDPSTGTLDYYPIRSNMAHAWVEVFYADYGWIEYDPTSEKLAEGETLLTATPEKPELYESLIKEILDTKNTMQEGLSSQHVQKYNRDSQQDKQLNLILKSLWIWVLLFLFVSFALISSIRYRLIQCISRTPRKKAIALANHSFFRVQWAGMPKQETESRGQWVLRINHSHNLNMSILFALYEKALFAPNFSWRDYESQKNAYSSFSKAFKIQVPLWKRIISCLLPGGTIFSSISFNKRNKCFILFLALPLLLLLAPVHPLYAAESQADITLRQAAAAVASEHWEQAIQLLNAGAIQTPGDYRFPLAQGDLYSGRKLFNMAWIAYQRAEQLNSDDPYLLYKEATIASRLNKDQQACKYLQRVLEKRPNDRDTVGDLAWIYFKLHRSQEGVDLLLSAIERMGSDSGFSMTLGTLYSDLFQYELSKKYYLDAIEKSRGDSEHTFEAVAHYNLSILETRFFQYDAAFHQTTQALMAADRSSGHLARGELYLKRLEFQKCFSEYAKAYQLDTSPLSKINLAQAYLSAGYLQEAKAYAEQALASPDLSWMHNYGTDIDQHQRDLHEILKDVYLGFARSEKTTLHETILEDILSPFQGIYYHIKSAFHDRLFRYYAHKVGIAYKEEGQQLEALHNFYEAFKTYPHRALQYLEKMQSLETKVIPASAPIYQLERACLLRDPQRIAEAIDQLDPIWEKQSIAEGQSKRISLLSEWDREYQPAVEMLFALNRGAVKQQGYSLPIVFSFEIVPNTLEGIYTIDMSKKVQAKLTALLNKSGFSITTQARFHLHLQLKNAHMYFILQDVEAGKNIVAANTELLSFSPKNLCRALNNLSDTVFRAN